VQNITTTLKKLFYLWRRSQVPVKQPIKISRIDNLIIFLVCILISIISFGLLILLILKQPNLSTASLTGILLWVMGLCGGVKLSSLCSFASLGFITGCISILNNEYQKLRVTSFINPWKDQQESGFQLVQSLLAIGSGGLFGQGFGLSIQKLQYLPFMYTDFIFAIFAEEFGLLGCTLF